MLGPNAASAPIGKPSQAYAQRLATRQGEAQKLRQTEAWIGWSRLVAFALVVVAFWLSFGRFQLTYALIPVPIAGFLFLLFRHDYIRRMLAANGRACAFYEQGMARLEDRWAGQGITGQEFLEPDHPFGADLDVFGPASLFELLCAARTRKGQATLADWLKVPATPVALRERQEAVQEMRGLIDLRERLAVLGGDMPAGADLAGLAAWGEAPLILHRPGLRLLATFLVTGTLLALIAFLLGSLGSAPLLLFGTCELLFAWRYRDQVQRIIKPIDKRAADLAVFTGILSLFEQLPCRSVRLLKLQEALKTQGQPPSRRIGELLRLVEWLDSRHNPFFAVIAPLLLWSTQHAFAFEEWRSRSGPAVRRWLDAVGELEALSCLAGFAFENPGNVVPEIVDEGVLFDGIKVGHPLLPLKICVCNDVRLDAQQRLLLVSGSNMSGKSTLLRAVGVNTILALAGAPVRAERLRISPLQVGATLRIQDSLQAGRSRFFAEIQRIRQLLDLASQKPPLLFMLDELLQGTNSHDRLLGAEGVVRALLATGAIGLLTTHDLALTGLVKVFAPLATNVHFQDHFENDIMVFDYCMRPGIVEKSNAVALMRAVGIPIEAERK
ncbi:MAG TPA: hypothetical protein VGP68_05720 [Gemmataceae bacterium]|jgi:hypothetical protein|nr:hypothetical protein [Gemmataceae bacterium]